MNFSFLSGLLGTLGAWLAERFKSPAAKIDNAIRQGYEICYTHYPPSIMLSTDQVNWTCPECGNTRSTGISFGTFSFPR